MNGIRISIEDPHAEEARELVDELFAELVERYGDDGGGAFQVEDVTGPGSCFLIARQDGRAIGCGALRNLGEGVGEVKRMYVRPAARGRGLGNRILEELERGARLLGYDKLRLETGLPQPEAIRLYERAGYHRIVNYGTYKGDPRTLSFEKELTGPA
jgi:putative acetyltransferase